MSLAHSFPHLKQSSPLVPTCCSNWIPALPMLNRLPSTVTWNRDSSYTGLGTSVSWSCMSSSRLVGWKWLEPDKTSEPPLQVTSKHVSHCHRLGSPTSKEEPVAVGSLVLEDADLHHLLCGWVRRDAGCHLLVGSCVRVAAYCRPLLCPNLKQLWWHYRSANLLLGLWLLIWHGQLWCWDIRCGQRHHGKCSCRDGGGRALERCQQAPASSPRFFLDVVGMCRVAHCTPKWCFLRRWL